MKKKRTRKIKIKKIISILGVIVILCLLGIGYTKLHIKNIYVEGNSILKEYEIIEEAGLLNYPKIYEVKKRDIKNKLLKNDLINDVDVRVTIFGKVFINVTENIVLYKDKNNYMLSNGKIVSLKKEENVPILINEINDEILDKFVKKYLSINQDILVKISEIEYNPTDLDKERFMFYMNDGNYVYITLSKINAINTYNEIYPTLDGKKGILYLDSGNHFEIKKS